MCDADLLVDAWGENGGLLLCCCVLLGEEIETKQEKGAQSMPWSLRGERCYQDCSGCYPFHVVLFVRTPIVRASLGLTDKRPYCTTGGVVRQSPVHTQYVAAVAMAAAAASGSPILDQLRIQLR